MRDAQRAELDALREQVERDAGQLREHAATEAEQLLTRLDSRPRPFGPRRRQPPPACAKRRVSSRKNYLPPLERASAALRQEIANQREHVMAELKEAQASANQAIEAMLAKATEFQRAPAST